LRIFSSSREDLADIYFSPETGQRVCWHDGGDLVGLQRFVGSLFLVETGGDDFLFFTTFNNHHQQSSHQQSLHIGKLFMTAYDHGYRYFTMFRE